MGTRERLIIGDWFVECVLTVEPWPRKHRRPVLNEREQRHHARAVAVSTRNLGADEAEGTGDIGAGLTALVAARLRRMARRNRRAEALALLRRAFGEEEVRTEAAAFMPDAPAPVESAAGGGAEAPAGRLPQDDPFDTDDHDWQALSFAAWRRLRASGRRGWSGTSSPRSISGPRGTEPVRRMRHVSA